MITDAFLAILFVPLTWLFSFMPSFTAPTGVLSDTGGGVDFNHTGEAIGSAMGGLDGFAPIGLLATCLAVVFAATAAAVVVRVVIFTYDKIPGKGSA